MNCKKVLVLGGGGREHAIVHALSRSPQVEKIYAAPGNAGIAAMAECVALKETQVDELIAFARENAIDLTVVGPEAALAVGVVDAFRAVGLKIFGPTKAATQIESSKEFAKDLMKKYSIPTAAYEVFDNYEAALEYVKKGTFPTVLKYDGLAAGKGVLIIILYFKAYCNKTCIDAYAVKSLAVKRIDGFLCTFPFGILAFVGDILRISSCRQEDAPRAGSPHRKAFYKAVRFQEAPLLAHRA